METMESEADRPHSFSKLKVCGTEVISLVLSYRVTEKLDERE